MATNFLLKRFQAVRSVFVAKLIRGPKDREVHPICCFNPPDSSKVTVLKKMKEILFYPPVLAVGWVAKGSRVRLKKWTNRSNPDSGNRGELKLAQISPTSSFMNRAYD